MMNKYPQYVFSPICIAASVMLGGCLGSESGDEEEVTTEAEPTAEEAEPTAEAAAAITWVYTGYSAIAGARVRFAPNGDYVEICDTKTDGKYAIAYYNNVYVHTGGGYASACKVVSNKNAGHDIPENIWVKFNVCLGANQYCKLTSFFNGN